MCLVERMTDEVQRSKGVKTQGALNQHEAHLRHGGPGQPDLDADAGQHHHARQHRGGQTEDQQEHPRRPRWLQQRRKPDQHKAAQVDHARMQQGGNRGGRFHDLDEPAVHRQQSRSQHDCQHQRNGAEVQADRQAVLFDVPPQSRQRSTAHFVPRKHSRHDQQSIGDPVSQAFFVGSEASKGAVRVETQQVLQGAPHHRPGGDHNQPMVRQQQQVDRSQHARQRRHVAFLTRLSLQVASGETADDDSQPLHEDPQRESEGRGLQRSGQVLPRGRQPKDHHADDQRTRREPLKNAPQRHLGAPRRPLRSVGTGE